MLMKIRRELVVGGAVAMLSVAILMTGTMFAQSATHTPASGAMPAGDHTGMMDMATPGAGMDGMMAMTMEQCMAMMMDMMGMMGDDEMSGMMATPAADAAPMAMTMEQCMAMMMDMMDMATPAA